MDYLVRGDVTNLNRVDALLGQDIRDDHDLIPNIELLLGPSESETPFAEFFLGPN